MAFIIVLLFIHIISTEGIYFPRNAKNIVSVANNDGDSGEPLFLTPYIERGELIAARNLSRVNYPGVPESYTGFFTVDKTYNSNHFFWYFPSLHDTTEDPVLLWLNGGPGASSLFGLFEENGPIKVENNEVRQREIHWAYKNHLIYIDSPVGTGFSFTDDLHGHCTNQTQVGEHLYSSLIQFFQLFPNLQSNEFFIIGESYAGKYIPALAYTIHKKNPNANIKINLSKLAIGNGFSDPINQMDYSEYLYQIGILDWQDKDNLQELQEDVKELILKEQWLNASNSWEGMMGLINSYVIKSHTSIYNYVTDNVGDFAGIFQKNQFRKAIHVGNLTYFQQSDTVYSLLYEDLMKSVVPWIEELLEHYEILFYSGQLDIIVAYPFTTNFLRNLNYSDSAAYQTINRTHFISLSALGAEQIGYIKKAGNLIEAFLRNGGHMVPTDQPRWTEALISMFMHNGIRFPINETTDKMYLS